MDGPVEQQLRKYIFKIPFHMIGSRCSNWKSKYRRGTQKSIIDKFVPENVNSTFISGAHKFMHFNLAKSYLK